MAWFDETSDEESWIRLEGKAAEIRKLLLGALLLAEERWKDDLQRRPAGLEVLRAIGEAEEDFVDSSLTDRLERYEDLLEVILKRSKGIFLLMEYLSRGDKG